MFLTLNIYYILTISLFLTPQSSGMPMDGLDIEDDEMDYF